MNKKEYQEYLKSDHWQKIRKQAFDRGGNHCAICRSTNGLQIHHNTYEHLGNEYPGDLVVLCGKCHLLYHPRLEGSFQQEAQKAKTGTAIEGGYIIIPKQTLRSPDWKGLKLTSRIVFISLLMEFIRSNKNNPKNLVEMSHKQIEDMANISHGSVARGIKELKRAGFLRIHQAGRFGGHPHVYQLNGKYLSIGSPDVYWLLDQLGNKSRRGEVNV